MGKDYESMLYCHNGQGGMLYTINAADTNMAAIIAMK
jgi:hypothetical protein